MQGAVNRTAVGDFYKPGPLFVVQGAGEFQFALNVVDQAGGGFTCCAVCGVDLFMFEANCDAFQGPFFSVGIHAEGNGGARTQGREKVVVRGRSLVGSAHFSGLIGEGPVVVGLNFSAIVGFAGVDNHGAGRGRFCRRGSFFFVEVFVCPGGDDRSDILRVGGVGEQVVGIIERDEAFGVEGGFKHVAGVVDAHDVVDGRVEDEQGPFETADGFVHVGLVQVVQELFFNHKGSSSNLDFGLPFCLDGFYLVLKMAYDMGGLTGSPDGGHGNAGWDFVCSLQDSGTSERVSDQDFGRFVVCLEVFRGGDKVVYIGGEIGVFKFAFAKAGEIEAKYGKAFVGEGLGDIGDSPIVFGAGEEVGKQSIGNGVLGARQVQAGGQVFAAVIGECKAL